MLHKPVAPFPANLFGLQAQSVVAARHRTTLGSQIRAVAGFALAFAVHGLVRRPHCWTGALYGLCFHTPQLAPNCDRRLSEGLELPNSPGARPGFDPCGAAALIMPLVSDSAGIVYVLRHVLGDVACGPALVHGLDEASPLCRALLGALIQPPPLVHDGPQFRSLFRLAPQQHVPVCTAVVMRLGHAESEKAHAFSLELSPACRPGLAEPVLRVARRRSVVFRIGAPHRVKSARRSVRREQSDHAGLVGQVFATSQAGHQLAASDRLVCRRRFYSLAQLYDSAVSRFQLGALQHRRIAGVV